MMVRWIVILLSSAPLLVQADWLSVPAPYHRARLSHLQIDDSERWFLSAADDGEVRLWQVKTRKAVWRTRFGHYQIEALALERLGRRAAVGLKNGTVVVYSLPDGLELYRSRQAGDPLISLRFSRAGKWLAAVYKSGRGVIVELKRKKTRLLPQKVNDIDFSPDGRWLASGPMRESGATRALIWDARTHNVIKKFEENLSPPEAALVRFSPDGKYLANASGTNLWLWSLKPASPKPVSLDLSPVPGELQPLDFVKRLRFSADGKLFQLSAFGTLFRYRVPSPTAVYRLDLSTFHSSSVRPSSRLLVGEKLDGVIWLLRLPKKVGPATPKVVPKIKPDKALCQAITSNLRKLALANPSVKRQPFVIKRAIELINRTCGKVTAPTSELNCMKRAKTLSGFMACTQREPAWKSLARLGGPRSIVKSLEFQPNSPWLATAGGDGSIALWDRRTGVLKRRLKAHLIAPTRVTFSRDGKLMASAGLLGEILIWSTTGYALLRVIDGHPNAVKALRFSHDGRWLVSGGADRRVHLWNVADGKRIRSFSGHSHAVVDLVVAAGDRLLASISEDATTRVWSLTSGKQLQLLKPPMRKLALRTVAFSPNGKRLFSATAFGSAPHWATIWDPQTGKVLLNFKLRTDPLSVAWTKNGLFLGLSDGNLEIRSSKSVSKVILTLAHGRGGYRLSLAVSPDGRYLASGSGGNQIGFQLWRRTRRWYQQ